MSQQTHTGDPASPSASNIPTLKTEDALPLEANLASGANAPKNQDPAATTDPTFMQNQISIQRSPSTAHLQASALSRTLSIKSNGSSDHASGRPALPGVLSEGEDDDENERRNHGRKDSDSSIIEATTNCDLTKSPSTSTVHSSRSTRSTKSVRSVHAVGNFPLGSLRVHSPSPSRASSIDSPECLKTGDVVIIRDIPAGSLFGYDTKSFTIPENGTFQGIKDIPSGTHFVWGSSATNTSRTGFWIMSANRASAEFGEIHVKRWDNYNECLSEEVSAAEIRIQKGSVAEILDKLQEYTIINTASAKSDKALSFSNAQQLYAKNPNIWTHLTSSMKGALLTKITDQPWNHWIISSSNDYKPPTSSTLADDALDFRREDVLRFVFPRSTRTFDEGAVGRDRTEQAMDTSSHIKHVIATYCTFEDQDEIIGEMQFCYITGMVLGNLACMEQWGHIVKILFRAFKLVLEMPVFFCKAIETFHTQLIYDEEGFEGSIFDHDPHLQEELKKLLTIFKSRLTELLLEQGSLLTDDQNGVGKAFGELESWLWKWGWDLRSNYVRSGKVQLEDGEIVDMDLPDFEDEDERGEYAPVMVDLDDEGREKGKKKSKVHSRHGSRSFGKSA